MNDNVQLLDAADVSRTVARIAHQIIEKTALDESSSKRVILLGIPTRGSHLAHRLASKTVSYTHLTLPTKA